MNTGPDNDNAQLDPPKEYCCQFEHIPPYVRVYQESVHLDHMTNIPNVWFLNLVQKKLKVPLYKILSLNFAGSRAEPCLGVNETRPHEEHPGKD